ncbi:hypothetical protein [Paenibacillus durus]|uniref:hypothetical protein n=1 Tax=Paenibacillus durus TaxID=44251 RepID=UPI00130D52D1|nr:hypothetical protein [Paenibacillus durus]
MQQYMHIGSVRVIQKHMHIGSGHVCSSTCTSEADAYAPVHAEVAELGNRCCPLRRPI